MVETERDYTEDAGLPPRAHWQKYPRLGVRYHYSSNTVATIADLPQGMCSLASVQSLAHHNLCSGSPPHMEAVHRVAAAVGPGCDAAASMPQTETLLEKNSSLVLQ